MAEFIKRSTAIKAVKHAWAKGLEPSQYIEALPAADVAPVVRCKNCVTGMVSDNNKYIICCSRGVGMEFDDFCSYGKRKDGGADHEAD